MRKIELIKAANKKSSITDKEAELFLENVLTVIKKSVGNGEPVFIRGFGTFTPKKRAAKIGQNIIAKTSVKIPAHFIPSFKPSAEFKKMVKSDVNNVPVKFDF
jgi:DNA-binding protein HU-beta